MYIVKLNAGGWLSDFGYTVTKHKDAARFPTEWDAHDFVYQVAKHLWYQKAYSVCEMK